MTTISIKYNTDQVEGTFGPWFGTFYKADGSEYTSLGTEGAWDANNTLIPFDETVTLSAGEWEFTYYQPSENTFEYNQESYSLFIGDEELLFPETTSFSSEQHLGMFEVRRTITIPEMSTESYTYSDVLCPAYKAQVRGAIDQNDADFEWGQVEAYDNGIATSIVSSYTESSTVTFAQNGTTVLFYFSELNYDGYYSERDFCLPPGIYWAGSDQDASRSEAALFVGNDAVVLPPHGSDEKTFFKVTTGLDILPVSEEDVIDLSFYGTVEAAEDLCMSTYQPLSLRFNAPIDYRDEQYFSIVNADTRQVIAEGQQSGLIDFCAPPGDYEFHYMQIYPDDLSPEVSEFYATSLDISVNGNIIASYGDETFGPENETEYLWEIWSGEGTIEYINPFPDDWPHRFVNGTFTVGAAPTVAPTAAPTPPTIAPTIGPDTEEPTDSTSSSTTTTWTYVNSTTQQDTVLDAATRNTVAPVVALAMGAMMLM